MDFLAITPSDAMWETVSRFARSCSWRAGASLSKEMESRAFTQWERVMVALNGQDIAAFCTAAKKDCIPNVPYTPYIGYVFVDEKYRGRRLSQRLLSFAMDYLKTVGFQRVYLVSDHENLYEKYGFRVVDRKMSPWGEMEKIFMHDL